MTRSKETENFKFYRMHIGEGEYSLICIDKDTRKELEFIGSQQECNEFELLVSVEGF